MRRLMLIPLLFFSFACADSNPIQPDDPPSGMPDQLTLAVSRDAGADPKWEFAATVIFVGTVGPEEVRIARAGIMFGKGLVNEWFFTGARG